MSKVYATTVCPYCNCNVSVTVKVLEETKTKTVQCDNYRCFKHFQIRYHAKVSVDIETDRISDRMQPMSPDKPPMRHVFHRFSAGDGSGIGMFTPLDSLPDAQDEEDAGSMAGIIMDASENARRLSHERDKEAIRTGKHNFWDELAKEAKRRGVVNPETGEVEFPKKASELRDFVDWVLGKEASEPWSAPGGTAEQAADTSNRGWTDKEPEDADKATSRSGNPFAAEWSRKALIEDDSEG